MNTFDEYIPVLNCDGNCGSPTYGYWGFYTHLNVVEARIFCGGCGKVQALKTIQKIVSDDYIPPVYNGREWVYA